MKTASFDPGVSGLVRDIATEMLQEQVAAWRTFRKRGQPSAGALSFTEYMTANRNAASSITATLRLLKLLGPPGDGGAMDADFLEAMQQADEEMARLRDDDIEPTHQF